MSIHRAMNRPFHGVSSIKLLVGLLFVGVSVYRFGAGRSLAGVDDLSRRPELVTAEAEAAVKRGLEFLAKSQAKDGAWRAMGGQGSYPCAMTSLAGLAVLASGNTSLEGPYAVNIRRAMDYVISSSNPNGVLGRMDEERSVMHGHGFAMLFLAQAYGTERDGFRREKIRKVLKKAVELTGQSQSRDGGWLYTPDSGGDEGSVTVTQIQGLRAVRNIGVTVPKTIIDRACKYIENSANPDGGIRYTARGGGPGRPPITAAAVATLYNAGQYDNPVAEKSLGFIKKLMESGRSNAEVAMGHEYYFILYAAQAMYLSSEENWKGYFPQTRDYLVKAQSPNGSWNGDGVGETYGTAVALIALQIPYKYLPILQR